MTNTLWTEIDLIRLVREAQIRCPNDIYGYVIRKALGCTESQLTNSARRVIRDQINRELNLPDVGERS
jgi:hypothetical protein